MTIRNSIAGRLSGAALWVGLSMTLAAGTLVLEPVDFNPFPEDDDAKVELTPEQEAELDRVTDGFIQLHARCGTLRHVVHVPGGNSSAIGQDAVETIVRNRLAAARLIGPSDSVGGILRVTLLAADHMFTYRIWLEKYRFDCASGIDTWSASGWEEWMFGSYSGNGHTVMNALSKDLDTFILEYLEFNDSCEESE